MNELVTNIHGKFPYVLDDIRFLDAAYRSAILAISKGIASGEDIILSGLEVTDNGNNSYTYSSGVVLLQGELLNVSGVTVNVPPEHVAFIVREESFDPAGLKVFGDGQLHNTYKIVEGRIGVGSDTPAQHHIEIDNAKRLDNLWDTAAGNHRHNLSTLDIEGILERGKLNNSHNLNDTIQTGLYMTWHGSLPENFPPLSVLGIESEPFGQNTWFWIKVIKSGSGEVYQEVGIRKGLLARRYKSNDNGWTPWVGYWARVDEVYLGNKKCSVVSPYTLQKHEVWSNPQHTGIGDAELSGLFVRKLTTGLTQIQGKVSQAGHGVFSHICNLAPKYRPSADLHFSVIADNTPAVLLVQSDGLVRLVGSHTSADINIIY